MIELTDILKTKRGHFIEISREETNIFDEEGDREIKKAVNEYREERGSARVIY